MFDHTEDAATTARLSRDSAAEGHGDRELVLAEVDVCASTLREHLVTAVDRIREGFSAHDDAALMVGAAEIDLIAVCETLVRIAQGAQLDIVQRLDARRRAATEQTVPDAALTRSLCTEIALARQVSGPAGQTTYTLARALEDHPQTHALLRTGDVSQPVAAAVCRETVYVDGDQKAQIDEAIASKLPELSARRAAKEARRLVLEADPHAAYARGVRAREDRAVNFKSELDSMATLTLYGPAEQLLAAQERLDRQASGRLADGDPRTHRQLMLDDAVEALTGARVRTDGTSDVGAEIGVLMRPDTLFGADDAPASLIGYGPIPAEFARRLAAEDTATLRRFFTTPDGDQVGGSDPRARRFSAAIRRLVATVDGQCQRPWCDCRIRNIDHITPYAEGGLSTPFNSQGTCQADNLTKEAPGWGVAARSTARETAAPDTTAECDVGDIRDVAGDDGAGGVGGADRAHAAGRAHGAGSDDGVGGAGSAGGDDALLADEIVWTTPTGHAYVSRRTPDPMTQPTTDTSATTPTTDSSAPTPTTDSSAPTPTTDSSARYTQPTSLMEAKLRRMFGVEAA